MNPVSSCVYCNEDSFGYYTFCCINNNFCNGKCSHYSIRDGVDYMNEGDNTIVGIIIFIIMFVFCIYLFK